MYMTQDLYLAVKRWNEHHAERVFYVVGDEQLYHFKVLFKILELFGYEWIKDHYVHVSYGMINLPEGKMKSREGTVVDADNLIKEIEALAKEEIIKRISDLEDKELSQRAETIALSALKFFILKVDLKTTMTYDSKASLDFEGDTGPYIQYTYARLKSILAKAGESLNQASGAQNYQLQPEERRILVWLSRFDEILENVTSELKIHHLAEYLLKLSAEVNSWYSKVSVLKAESTQARIWRLKLVQGVSLVLHQGQKLLGIEVLERM